MEECIDDCVDDRWLNRSQERKARHPPPGAATRHPKRVSHLCTFAQERRSDLHLFTASSALWPTGQRINRSTRVFPMPPCHHAHVPPLAFHASPPLHGLFCPPANWPTDQRVN